jgi:ATP-dependent DNA ligase
MLFSRAVEDALTRFQLHERGDARLARQPAPMLLGRAEELFADPDWTYEPKWDGFRALATVRDGTVRLISRNGHSFTNLFWPISDALLTRGMIFEELKATRRKTCPFPTVPVLRDHFHELPDTPPEWVRQAVVVEVEYQQRNGAVLRHAVLNGIRPGQPARQVVQSPQPRRGSF